MATAVIDAHLSAPVDRPFRMKLGESMDSPIATTAERLVDGPTATVDAGAEAVAQGGKLLSRILPTKLQSKKLVIIVFIVAAVLAARELAFRRNDRPAPKS